jgi:uncharacterized protein (DUF58 family)
LAALCAAVLADGLRLRGARGLRVERTLPARAGLSEPFERVLLLEAPQARFLDVEVRERFPDSFRVRARTLDGAPGSAPLPGDPTGGPDRARFDAQGIARLTRVYRPDRRGPEALGEVRVRVTGPLGLLEREWRFPARQELRVRPALKNLPRTLRLADSERWRELGLHREQRRGGQWEFESLREYVPGDERRHVDWKASARRGRPTVRQFDVERGQELWLLVDCGRRMGARSSQGDTAGWSKLDHALDAALELAAVALRRGDRVGALAFDDGVRAYVPASRGEAQFARLEQALFDLAPLERESDLGRALREVAVRSPRRALVLVVSEVADPLSSAAQAAALSRASRRHRVVFAALDDPDLEREAGPSPSEGQARDDSHPAEASMSAEDRAALRAAMGAARAERDGALATLRGGGARVLRALPAESAGALLGAWLDERRG